MNSPEPLFHRLRPLLAAVAILNSPAAPLAAQDVSIPDPGLNAAVRDALQKPNAPLTQPDLLSLTNLDASGRSVKSISGLEAARNLVSLDLQSNLLTNISVPAAFTRLASLNLSLNLLTNVALPGDLGRLQSLNLGFNQLASISLPAGLTNLSELYLAGNQLNSLVVPPDMTQLSVLGFQGNPLGTFAFSEPLAAATNLTATVADLQSQGVSVLTYPLAVRLIRIRQPIGAFQFAVEGPPGAYAVMASDDLAAWSDLAVTTNALGRVVFTDTNTHLVPRRFYRARRLP